MMNPNDNTSNKEENVAQTENLPTSPLSNDSSQPDTSDLALGREITDMIVLEQKGQTAPYLSYKEFIENLIKEYYALKIVVNGDEGEDSIEEYLIVKSKLRVLFSFFYDDEFKKFINSLGYSHGELSIASFNDSQHDLSQSPYLDILNEIFENAIATSPFEFEKYNRRAAIKELDDGICHAITVDLLCRALKREHNALLDKYREIISWDAESDIIEKADKIVAGQSFLFKASNVFPKLTQEQIIENMKFVQDEIQKESILTSESLVGSVFSKKELSTLLSLIIKPERMVVASFIGHTLGFACLENKENVSENKPVEQENLPRKGLSEKGKPEHQAVIKKFFQEKIGQPGKSVDNGDCFYDSIAQELNAKQKNNSGFYTVKGLREMCSTYMNVTPHIPEGDWIKAALKNNTEADTYEQHLANVKYTQEEMTAQNKEGEASHYAIWGKAHIEGKILAEMLGIKLHIVEFHDEEIDGQPISPGHMLVTKDKAKQVENKDIDYEDERMIHLAVYRGHFVPIQFPNKKTAPYTLFLVETNTRKLIHLTPFSLGDEEAIAEKITNFIFTTYEKWLDFLSRQENNKLSVNSPVDMITLSLNTLRLTTTPSIEYNTTAINELVEKTQAELRVGPDKGTAFILAVQNGDIHQVKKLLKQYPEVCRMQIYGERLPLHVAAQQGNAEIFELLLKETPELIDAVTAEGQTSFYIACEHSHLDILRLLIKYRTKSINQATHNGQTPLLIACGKGIPEIVDALLNEFNPPASLINPNNYRSPLLIAIDSGSPNIVDILLKAGADVNEACYIPLKEGQANAPLFPLYHAAYLGFEFLAQTLISHGANINARNYNHQETIMHAAASSGQLSLIKILIEKDKDLTNAMDTIGRTPILSAIEHGKENVVTYFIENGLASLETLYTIHDPNNHKKIIFTGGLIAFALFQKQKKITDYLMRKAPVHFNLQQPIQSPLYYALFSFEPDSNIDISVIILNLLLIQIPKAKPIAKNQIFLDSIELCLEKIDDKIGANLPYQSVTPKKFFNDLALVKSILTSYPKFIELQCTIHESNLDNITKEMLLFFEEDLTPINSPSSLFTALPSTVSNYNEILKGIKNFIINTNFDKKAYSEFFTKKLHEISALGKENANLNVNPLIAKIGFFITVELKRLADKSQKLSAMHITDDNSALPQPEAKLRKSNSPQESSTMEITKDNSASEPPTPKF